VILLILHAPGKKRTNEALENRPLSRRFSIKGEEKKKDGVRGIPVKREKTNRFPSKGGGKLELWEKKDIKKEPIKLLLKE